MTRLDELKSIIKTMFENSTDTAAIEQSAVLANKIEEVEAEQQKQQDQYTQLLGKYKETVLHSSFKPQENDVGTATPEQKVFDADEYTAKFLESLNKKN